MANSIEAANAALFSESARARRRALSRLTAKARGIAQSALTISPGRILLFSAARHERASKGRSGYPLANWTWRRASSRHPRRQRRRGVPRGYSQERKPATEVTPPRGRAPGRRVASPVGSPAEEQRKTRLYGAASNACTRGAVASLQDRLKANENRDTAKRNTHIHHIHTHTRRPAGD